MEGGNSGASGNSSVVAHTIVADIETTAKATPDPLSPSRNKEVCAVRDNQVFIEILQFV